MVLYVNCYKYYFISWLGGCLMKKIFYFLILIFLLVLPVAYANNDIYYVGNNVTVDGQGTVDDPYNNLNLALRNSGDNDTILINEGIYSGKNNSNLIISNNNLLIKANGDVTLTGSNIFTNNGNNLILSGLKFINCTDTAIWNNKKINLYNLSFYNNYAEDAGCVESVRGAYLTIDSCLFVGNNATQIDGGAVSNKGTGSITNSVFISNWAYRDGGALRNYGGILTVNNCTFINNTANGEHDGSFGGAIYHWIGTINVSDSLFVNNYARDCGGAIHICKGRMHTAYANMTIFNNIFIENEAKDGGAIYLEGCVGDVYGNAFVNNKRDTVFLSDYFIQYYNSTIDGNWWGENSPDWSKVAKNLETPNSLVTLNLTVDSKILGINQTTNYNYAFYLGDEKADIPQREIKITSDGGNLTDNTFSSDAEGIYHITASSDNENIVADVIVSDNPVILNVEDVIKYYGGNESLVVNLTDFKFNPISNATVSITVNGRQYNRSTNDFGIATMDINLNNGIYVVETKYLYYSVNSTVTVKSTVNGSDIVKIFKNQTQYSATFLDAQGNYLEKGSIVRFNINGVFYNRTVNEKGIARLNINLNQGNYIITAMNLITGENSSNNITVLANIVENKDLVKYYRNASQYIVKILGSNGNPVGANESVIFNINGVFYTRFTNESGYAKLNINLKPGEYIITCEYKGCFVSNNITVLEVLFGENLVKTFGNADQFHVTLLDGQGNLYPSQNITFNINGVFYNRLTNSSGVASLNINLMPGEYIITSSFNDDNIANVIKVEEI